MPFIKCTFGGIRWNLLEAINHSYRSEEVDPIGPFTENDGSGVWNQPLGALRQSVVWGPVAMVPTSVLSLPGP